MNDAPYAARSGAPALEHYPPMHEGCPRWSLLIELSACIVLVVLLAADGDVSGSATLSGEGWPSVGGWFTVA